MTETGITDKALALVNEVGVYYYPSLGSASMSDLRTALCRAIEEHERFRQDVSDAVEAVFAGYHDAPIPWVVMRRKLEPFIIPKPVDPLVEAMQEACGAQGLATKHTPGELTEHLRAAIEKRGGKIVWGEG